MLCLEFNEIISYLVIVCKLSSLFSLGTEPAVGVAGNHTAPVRGQLTDCYQLEAPVDQFRNQNLAGIGCGIIKIMHQNNVSVLRLFQHGLNGCLRISCFPVQGINGPEHCRMEIAPTIFIPASLLAPPQGRISTGEIPQASDTT